MSTIGKNVPGVMTEYENYLDKGITFDMTKLIITLDYDKILQRSKMTDDTFVMDLFLHLRDYPFSEIIEHPLCKSFLSQHYDRIVWFFMFFHLFPHLLLSGEKI